MPIIHSQKSHTFNLEKFYFVNRAICSGSDFLCACLLFLLLLFSSARTHYIPFHFFFSYIYFCHYCSSARGQSKQLNSETNCVESHGLDARFQCTSKQATPSQSSSFEFFLFVLQTLLTLTLSLKEIDELIFQNHLSCLGHIKRIRRT